MPEKVIGAHTKDIVHQTFTKEGSLTVTYNKKDFVANTIGHVLAVPTIHTLLWTWGSAFKHPSKELATQLFDRYKDVPWKGDVLVRVGHSSIIGDIQRMLARNEKIRGRPWLLKDKPGRFIETIGKVGLSILQLLSETTVVGEAVLAKMFRMDFYNPYANTVTVYHPKLGIGMHELGHAEYFNNQVAPRNRLGVLISRFPELIINKNIFFHVPIVEPYLEYRASANAMKHFKTDEERREGLKMLEGAWSTYVFNDVLNWMLVPEPLRSAIGIVLAYPASVTGHLMNRLYPKKDQRFGYIFEGKKSAAHMKLEQKTGTLEKPIGKPTVRVEPGPPKKRELTAHQVLVATAKPVGPKFVPEQRLFHTTQHENGKQKKHSNFNRVTF